jgi:bacterioferritin (cytochrome b1)
MRDHVGMMEDFGDYTSSELIRDELETLEDHAHHLEHYLEDDTLVLDEATH